MKLFYPLQQVVGGDSQQICRLDNHLLLALPVPQQFGAGQGLYTSRSGADAGVGQNLEQGQLTGMAYVNSAAEFPTDITDGHHPDLITVFFTEEGHGALLQG